MDPISNVNPSTNWWDGTELNLASFDSNSLQSLATLADSPQAFYAKYVQSHQLPQQKNMLLILQKA